MPSIGKTLIQDSQGAQETSANDFIEAFSVDNWLDSNTVPLKHILNEKKARGEFNKVKN